jgi:hypothetical protein
MKTITLNHCDFGDLRLSNRFLTILTQLSSSIGTSIPSCGVVWGQTKAIYRFLSNPNVTPQHILNAEQERMLSQSIRTGSKRLYHLQDTTILDYSDTQGRYDLGCLNYINKRGMYVHTSLVLNADQVVEGVLNQTYLERSERLLGSSRSLVALQSNLPVEAKESGRWVHDFEAFQSLVCCQTACHGISICDAEGDFYELFSAKKAENVDLIVRLQHDHLICASEYGEAGHLLERLQRQPSQGFAWTQVVLSDKHSTRQAQLEIRFQPVKLPLPERLRSSTVIPQSAKAFKEQMHQDGPLTLYAVQATEINPPAGVEPIEWTLFTTMPVEDYWQALEIIQIYAVRWQIELFHLALKEGCKVQELQLETRHRLQKAIAIYSLIAANVVKMRYLAQYCPNQPMTITGFSVQNYFTLVAFLQTNYGVKLPTPAIPTVEQFTKALVLIAGGKTKTVGIRKLWAGLTKADIIFKTVLAIQRE